MHPFIRSDQYHFIQKQADTIVNGHNTVNDFSVLHALRSMSQDKVLDLFPDVTEEQKQILLPINEVVDSESADAYLKTVKQFVIPFQKYNETTIKKLFPKVKKLKLPNLENIDLREISYLSWHDKGSNKNFMIVPFNNTYTGLVGTFTNSTKKGICTICNRYEEVGMFIHETKGVIQGTYTNRGNYICKNNIKCNQNIMSLDKMHDFIEQLKGH